MVSEHVTDESLHWTRRAHRTKTPSNRKTYDGLDAIWADLADMLRPPERLTITETMEKYVRIVSPGAYIGNYRSDFVPYMEQPANTLTSRDHNGVIFVGPAQTGKALWTETPIVTPSGWTTMGELCPGNWVYAENGQPCRVLGVSPIRHDKRCYRVEFDDGTEIIADAEHLWDVDDDYSENRKLLRTETIALRYRYGARNHRFRYAIPNAAPICGNTQDLAVDPYTLGCWLGDGHIYSSIITSHRDDAVEIVDRIRACYTVRVSPQQTNTVNVHIDPSSMVRGRSIRDGLYDLNLLKNDVDSSNEKHIPNEYLRASVEQRRELLCGLMDTDGWVSGSICGFSSTVLGLANDVYELIVSLGYKPRFSVKNPVYTYKGKQCKGQPSFNLTFVAYSDDFIPFHLSRKASKVRSRAMGRLTHAERRRIVRVEEVESVPVRCISVDNPSGLFLAGKQMVPTHNTEALILGWLAYSVRTDPSDMIIFSPTQSAARDFSMRRVTRLHRHSPEIGNMMLKTREASTRFDKQYKTGMIVNLSWPSVAEFAGRPVGRIALTDYDRMPDDVDGEGSPYDLGSKRTTTFGSFAMTMAESSPSRDVENARWVRTTKHEAPPCKGILGLYNRGDRRRWYWPCPHCDSYFEGQWSDLQWQDKGAILQSAETVVMICPVNGCVIEQNRRQEMQQWGVWLRDGESIDEEGRIAGEGVRSMIASFWLNGVAAAFSTWTTLVVNYLNAMQEYERTGSEDSLRKWTTTDLGQPYIPKALDTDRLPEVLKARAEKMPYREMEESYERVHRETNVGVAIEPLVPPDVRCLIAAVDVQNHLFVVGVYGIAPGEPFDLVAVDRFQIRKSHRLDANGESLWVRPAVHLEDWAEITEEVVKRTYELSDGSGRRMSIKLTVCDSGGIAGCTTNAYNYQRSLKAAGLTPRFMLVKGDTLPSRPRTQVTYPDANQKDKLSAARGDVPVMLLNANALKDAMFGRLENNNLGKGMFRYPDWLCDWFYSELCSEIRTDKGWIRTNQKRNEAIDLSYYALGACVSPLIRAEGINWQNPPGWAKSWDQGNDLIYSPAVMEKPFDKPNNSGYGGMDFAALGKVLG